MSRIKRSFTVLVSLLVLMTSALVFPVSGVAAAEADVQTEQPVSAMVRIIEEEAIEKREEGVKYFRNNDNSFTAVVYDAPVHYEVDGKLEEIDNTLVLKKDADGQNVWQNRANDFSVSFPSSHNTGKVSVEYRGNALNFRLLPSSTATAKLSTATSVVQPTSETALKEKLDSDLLAAQTDEEIAELLNADRSAVRNQSSEISYTNVLPNTTLQYQLSGKSLKENLIFETVPQATSFTYAFEYTGLVGVLQENGAVLFYEKEDTVRENYVFMIAPPYMFDSGDSLTMDVAVSFTETKTGALYTLTPSASWLNSPDRVYPVVLDPTIDTQQNSTMIEDVHVNEDSPTQNYYTVDRMYAGSWKSGSTIYENRIFMRFQLPTQITNPAWIRDAYLTMSYYPTYSYQSTSELELEIYPVTSSWTSSTVKWSNQPSFASWELISSATSNKGTSAELNTHKDTWPNIASMVIGWYNGTNNGFVIKPKTKDTAKTNRACYVSSDSGVQAKRPVISIVYECVNFPPLFDSFINSNILAPDKVDFTNDGLFLTTTPISEILGNNSISFLPTTTNYTSTAPSDRWYVHNYFDDWYLFAVKNGASVSYGLYKMREQETDNYDNNDPGVTIPFVGFDGTKLTNCLSNSTGPNKYALYQELVKVTGPEVPEADDVITSYFANTSSSGAYLIAEKSIAFFANCASENIISAPNNLVSMFEEIAEIDDLLGNVFLDNNTRLVLLQNKADLQRVPDALGAINTAAGKTIFDFDDYTITVQDKNSLTLYEKQAILACFTANVTFNSFAAEVEFHADAINNWQSNIPILGNEWYERAIRADMAIGEEYESGFYDEYYDLDSAIVRAQADAHGEY